MLIDKLGDTGRKLHTGRSRNDQVSTDFRLWIRDALDRVDQLLLQLQQAFVGRCDQDFETIIPAYTHLQRAQPVLASHYWLAYCENFSEIVRELPIAESDLMCPASVLPLWPEHPYPLTDKIRLNDWDLPTWLPIAWMSQAIETSCWNQPLHCL